ncbi:MAG: IS4 family transposase [Gemmatimonadota bacterium]
MSATACVGRPIRRLRDRIVHQMGLAFQDVLPQEMIDETLAEIGTFFRERVFSPSVTLWAFLAQVLDPDPSCRQAVSRVIAQFRANGRKPPSSQTGAYCQARKRFPREALERLVSSSARTLEEKASREDLWKGRRIRSVDGSTVSMPDTPENQKKYPQPSSQAPGCGFPQMRIVALFGLVTGAVVGVTSSALSIGENPLFRRLWGLLDVGDILLGDRGFCSYANIHLLKKRGVDLVVRLAGSRDADFRKGEQLGPDDRLVPWKRPQSKPKGLSKREFLRLPQSMEIRQLRFRIEEPGFRTKTVVLATTLLDREAYPREELAALYGLRWNVEVHLRDLKISIGMDVLRGRSPEVVDRELLVHLLAYNLIRTMMWDAAKESGVPPLRLSFKGAVQHVRTFAPLLAVASATKAASLYATMRDLIAGERLPDRPGRIEPRLKKRRPKSYGWLQKPRKECQALLRQRLPLK